MPSDADRGRAMLAAALVPDRYGAQTEDDLAQALLETLRDAALFDDPSPNADVAAFVSRARQPSFAYARAVDDLSDADVQRNSAAWSAAYAELSEGREPVIRIVAYNTGDLGMLRDAARAADVDIAMHVDALAPVATWNWPLRVGVLRNGAAYDDVHAAYPELTQVIELDDQEGVDVDVLIALDAARQELAKREIRAGVVVLDGTGADSPRDVLRQFKSFAVLTFPEVASHGWWADVLAELSHDSPLDVAVRRLPNAVLVAASSALMLTQVRTYSAMLVDESGDQPIELNLLAPKDIQYILTNLRFDQESGGARELAHALRETGAEFPVTVGFPMAEPPMIASTLDPSLSGGGGVAGSLSAFAPEPPQTAWPRIDAPDEVAAGATFPATIGLRPDEDPGVQAVLTGALPRTEDVDVHVIVDGFELVQGELRFTVNLAGTAAKTIVLHAVDDANVRAERTIGVQYTVGGALRAYAMRPVQVTGAPAAPPDTVELAVDDQTAATPIAATPGDHPTLELTLQQGADVSGRQWQWAVTSGEVDVDPGGADLHSLLDETAKDLQTSLVNDITRARGTKLYDQLYALGIRLAEKMPDTVVQALHDAAAKTAPHPPSVLLISSEARIPWELAVVKPPIVASDSPFLCAQVHFGRWVVGRNGRPGSPPASFKAITSRAVIAGDYAGMTNLESLPEVQAETAALVADGAQPLPAEYDPVRSVVHGDPPVDLLHFATHGRFLEGQTDEGLILVDRSTDPPKKVYFTPLEVEAGDLPTAPFVFLNACQLGAGETILGDYAGMASAFLRIGATGVVAPLWEVVDAVAAQAAREFYAAVDSGATVGEAVSELRAKFTEAAAKDPATATYGSFLAYQYFGHPNLTLPKGP